MKAIVIGAGLIGVATAYVLGSRGVEVTVLDRNEGAGQETSFGNGTLLTPGMAQPWNAPGIWRALLGSLGRSNAAMQLHLHAVPSLARWGFTFLRSSQSSIFERNARSNLKLSLYSLKVMHDWAEQTHIEYGRLTHGLLRVFRNTTALDSAAAASDRLRAHGLKYKKLSREETVDMEPGLEPIAKELIGALHYEDDESGDAYQFCVALAERARDLGVQVRFGTTVSSLEVDSKGVVAALTDRERLIADHYIVAAGSQSTSLLRSIGVQMPVQPVKGYSVTTENRLAIPPLRTPVIDDEQHVVVAPLQGAIRIAGVAEFAGYDSSLPPERIRSLLTTLRNIVPHHNFDPAAAKAWSGLRPMSADGVPIVGRTTISNLFVNTGHGHVGWTMAAGSAALLAGVMLGDVLALDASPYSPNRFRR